MNYQDKFLFLPKLFILVLGLVLFCGCRGGEVSGRDVRNVVVVSVEPHAFLVERIGGEFVRVEVLVPMGKEPESYQPTPERIVMLTRAKIFFRTGMPFEQVIIPKLKSLASDLKIIDLRNGIKLRPLEFHNHDSHNHNSHNHDSHDHNSHNHNSHNHVGHSDLQESLHDSGSDPHIWFSLSLLKVEAATVLSALIEIDRSNEELYRKNYEDFILELEAVGDKLRVMLEPVKGKTIFVFHPTYGYFCDEFNLNQRAIEIGGKTPGPQKLVEVINEALKSGTQSGKKTTIFVQPEFNRTPAKSVAEAVNGRIVEHSALERNIFNSMINFAEEITR
ncbi:MAG: zinc ABC transporter substrate-binding protein [Planctomycetaceae bacterium]|jgi:zinc transport system substrate-binding protein|nr:zinc ABC transporter substrate-binding protein [Planctomycetaceae bacterium]